METFKIKVTTEQLKSVVSEVTGKISAVQKAFGEVDEKISRSVSYWESQGQVAMRENYDLRKDDYNRVFKEFDEQIKKLREMAGLYEQTEKSAQSISNALPSDVLS